MINIRQQLTSTNFHKSLRLTNFFWLSLSFLFSIIYSYLALKQAFSGEYVVQDDARQHVFWMLRFLDGNLFPNDLIANYFQSVAPFGYSRLYSFFASVGFSPIFLHKILPSLLGFITTGYCFGVCMQILPVPFTGFMATLILNQNLWSKSDLVSATPRAFVYPFFLAFLYYLLRKNLFPCLIAIALLGLFYPQLVFICVGILILRLCVWGKEGLRLSQERHHYIFCLIGVGLGILVLLPYALKSSEFEPVITLEQAKQLPEFFPGGRSSFFNENTFYYFLGGRSGILPGSLSLPITLCSAFLLPLILFFRYYFPILKKITGEIVMLLQVLVASTFMFVVAHILLFKFHLPGRYTGHSFTIVFALSAAIALTVIIDKLLSIRLRRNKIYTYIQKTLTIFCLSLICISLIFYYPLFIKNFPKTGYIKGDFPALYDFFQKQPQQTLIASIAEEANNLPTFSQRSILAGREYAIPYHLGYYQQFRQRTLDLFQANYSPNLEDVKKIINTYKLNFWMIESGTFTPEYLKNNRWSNQYLNSKLINDELVKLTNQIYRDLEQGVTPALSQLTPKCKTAEFEPFVVLDAKCITNVKSLE